MRIIKFIFDKLLNGLVFVFACILIISQLYMTVSKLDSYFSEFDAIYTVAESYEKKTVDLKIKLIGLPPDGSVFVLSNGEAVACFTDKVIDVTIKNNSVIEIDGRRVKKQFKVEILNADVSAEYDIPNEVVVKSNIAMLGRLIID